jgi:GAF domain-containing protein
MTVDRIQYILDSVYEKILTLLKADRFYVLLYDPLKKELSFPLVSEKGEKLPESQGIWAPRAARSIDLLPDCVLLQTQSLSYEQNLSAQIQQTGLTYGPGTPLPVSWLGTPIRSGGQALGALVVESWHGPQVFGDNERRLLEAIAQQTGQALQNARLYQQLERKVDYLRILNRIGQQITSGIHTTETGIIEKIYQQANQLPLDTKNMYVALYDADQNKTTFPSIHVNKETVKFASRPVGNGLTEWVIQNKAPKLIHTKEEAEIWYPPSDRKANIEKPFVSWIGAPMIYGKQVLGIIATYHETEEYQYDEDDLEVLQTLAGQAAVAIQNLRLYEAWVSEREKADAATRLAVVNDMASEFAHQMNNLAGTIPVWVNLAKEKLDDKSPRDAKILEYLNKVHQDSKRLLQAAQMIKKTTETGHPEPVKINELIEIAIRKSLTIQPNIEDRITIIKNLGRDIPSVDLEREKLLDTLSSIIKNGLEAIPQTGELTISTRRSPTDRNMIEILVEDTGIGIPSESREKIFNLFYTTKGPSGLGYGLWRDRAFIKALGGDIVMQSTPPKGTIFTIKIPVKTANIQAVKQEQE